MIPPQGTLERWAWDYVHAASMPEKLEPGRVPDRYEEDAPPRRILAPGRPPELSVASRAKKTRGIGSPHGRARTLHTFFHHELQAAELMAWAILAFPRTPLDFRVGLARILVDEARHMRLYARHIERLGFALGAFPVRDWFWERVPACPDPASFVAVMGLGLESANLEHANVFAARFREVGDEEGARVQELVAREEIGHARFGARWFRAFTGELTFDAWRRALPPPLSPMLMRGKPLQREARRQAEQPEPFLEELEAWSCDVPGS